MKTGPLSTDEVLIQHALATLPDSIASRKSLLRAVTHKIANSHPDYRRVCLMLVFLEKHEAQQATLPLSKPKTRRIRPYRDGNGDGNGQPKGDGK